MKTTIKFLLSLLGCGVLTLAVGQHTDTIYVNQFSTTTLLFPYQVGLVEIGNDNFAAQPDGKLVLIKTIQPSAGLTNLLIRYGDDHYFIGYIGYRETVKQQYHDYRLTLNPYEADTLPGGSDEPIPKIEASTVTEILNQHRPKLDTAPLVQKTKDLVTLSLLSVQNGPELTYLWFRLENHTALPYHVRKVNVQYRSRARTRRLDDQVIRRPLIAPQIPETVAPYSQEHLCFAIPHFASGKRSRLEILIGERAGNRVVMLPLKNTFIINAQILNRDEITKP